MEVLPSVYIEPDLSCFVRHTISAGGSIHHLTAVHEIVHAVFNDRHQSFFVDSIEVNQSLSCDLNLGVAFDEIDEATFFNFVILLPTVAHRVVVISSSNSFEEENGVRWVGHEDLVVDKVHLTQTLCHNRLCSNFWQVAQIDSYGLTVSVEAIDAVMLEIVKVIYWEI